MGFFLYHLTLLDLSFFFSLIFDIYYESSYGPLRVHMFGVLYEFRTWLSIAFPRTGEFSVTISSNNFLIFSLSVLLEPLGCTWYRLRDLLTYPHLKKKKFVFLFVFSFCCSAWVLFNTLSSRSLISSSAFSNLLLLLCSVFYVSFIVFFDCGCFIFIYLFFSLLFSVSSSTLLSRLVSIFITITLNIFIR